MGATSWRSITPYQPDPEAALQTLRAEVFARGEYVDPTGPLENRLQRTAERLGHDPDSPEIRAEMERAHRLQQAIQSGQTHGLSRAERALVERVRAMERLASLFGAFPPEPGEAELDRIDALLQRAGECGTHSVLDIEHVAAEPGFGVATPLAATTLRRMFGTTEPTHDQVEEHWSDIADTLDQWQACYLVVYRDGQPHRYAFIGCSGD